MTQDKELCFLWDNTIHGAIPAFEKFEAAFAFEKVFEHPYCPEEVDLKAYILKPNGDQKQISGFWYEGFQRVLRNGREILFLHWKRIGESVIPPRCPENTATM